MDKRGMEMWEIILLILAIMLLVFVIAWYSGLNKSIAALFQKFGEMF